MASTYQTYISFSYLDYISKHFCVEKVIRKHRFSSAFHRSTNYATWRSDILIMDNLWISLTWRLVFRMCVLPNKIYTIIGWIRTNILHQRLLCICLQSATFCHTNVYRAQASCTVTLLPPPLPLWHFLPLVWRWRYLFWLSELETPTGDMFTSAEAASHCDWLHSVYVFIKRLMYSCFRPHFIDINLKVNAFHQIFTVETYFERKIFVFKVVQNYQREKIN